MSRGTRHRPADERTVETPEFAIGPPPISDTGAAGRRFERKSSALTDYKELPGRSHFTVGEKGWEEVADYALAWAVEHARAGAPV